MFVLLFEVSNRSTLLYILCPPFFIDLHNGLIPHSLQASILEALLLHWQLVLLAWSCRKRMPWVCPNNFHYLCRCRYYLMNLLYEVLQTDEMFSEGDSPVESFEWVLGEVFFVWMSPFTLT